MRFDYFHSFHKAKNYSENNVIFVFVLCFLPTFFADNGKWSYRSYPDLAETCHSTDEKVLKIIKPFTRRFDDFPNLKLTDAEWAEVLEGRWPVEGKIPEADKPNSFKVW